MFNVQARIAVIQVKMEKKSVKHLAKNSFHGLKVEDVVVLMELLNMREYCELVRDKLLDGDKLLSLTEGKAMLWRPKVSIKNLMKAIEDMKANPEKYTEIIYSCRNSRNGSFEAKGKYKEQNSICVVHEERNTCDPGKAFGIETSLNLQLKNSSDTCMNKFIQNKQSVSSKECFMVNINSQRGIRHTDSVDMFIKSIKPERTFLYSLKNRNSAIHNPYLPMDINIEKHPCKRKFKTMFDSDSTNPFNYNDDKMSLFPYDNQDDHYCIPGHFEDRGYYVFNIRRGCASELHNKYIFPNAATHKPTRNSLSNLPKINDDNENSITEHFYEDLNDNKNDYKTESGDSQFSKRFQFYPLSKSACMLRVSEIVSILSCPKQCKFKYNLRKSDKITKQVDSPDLEKPMTTEKYKTNRPESHKKLNEFYEENSAIYDVIRPTTCDLSKANEENNDGRTRLEVEDYLEPIRPTRDYSDVVYEPQDESIVTTVLKMFENNFKLKKDQPNRKSQPIDHDGYLSPPPKPIPVDKKRLQEIARRGAHEVCAKGRGGMADRPLPVPVESEFYYMQVDREQAQELLEGHADGTFILRPSSQDGYVYSMSLVYQQRVFNLGVRRRPDNRLALGFSKNSEQSFQTIKELIEYHYKEKLVLIVKGEKVGRVLLKKLHG